MNSPSRGSGITSPAAGMRHLPARRIPASSKDASSALVHLDLPHGSVEGAIGWRFVGVGALWMVQIAVRNGETETSEIGGRKKNRFPVRLSFSLYSGCYPPVSGAVTTRQLRRSYRWITQRLV